MTDILEATERQVIGAALCWPDVCDTVELEPHHFRSPLAQRAWQEMRRVRDAGSIVDEFGIAAACEGELATKMQGYLAGCSAITATSSIVEQHAAIVRDAYVARRVRESIADLQDRVERDPLRGSEMLDELLASLTAIDVDAGESSASVRELAERRMVQLREMQDARERGEVGVAGIPTGIDVLDRMLGGLQRGVVSIIAARPGHGKSSLGLALADNGSRAGLGVHVFSLEDSMEPYSDRALARSSRVPAEKLRTGQLNQGDMQAIRQGVSGLVIRQGWIVDFRSGLAPEQIIRSVRRKRRDNVTSVVIVDYLQIVQHRRGLPLHQAIGESMNAFADAAKQDGMAYVVMSQLSREIEKRPDKRPLLSDLAESGTIEQRAKAVIGMYRSAMYDERAPDNEIELHVLKNSNGRTGYVKAHWDGPTTTIR